MAYDGSIKFSIDIDQDLAEDKLNELKSNLDDMANELSKKDLKYGEKLASDFDKTNQSIAETINKLREAEAQLERIQFDMQDWEATGGGENLELTQAYESAKLNVNELKQSLSEMIPEQQSLTNRAMVFSDKIIETKNNSIKLSKETDNVSKAMTRSSRSAKSMSDNIGGGVKKVLRYGLALFSIRSIYTMLSRLSREWMNSNDVAAKQMNANVQALSNGLQNLLAPILQTIMGWITTLMGYVNALTKAFFGVSIFTAKTNKNLGGSVGNAKKLSKEAKKFTASFDDAEVASENIEDNLDGGAGGAGGMDLPQPSIPTPDISGIMSALNTIKEFWYSIWDSDIMQAFMGLISSIIVNSIESAISIAGNLWGNLVELWDAMLPDLTRGFEAMKLFWTNVFSDMADTIDKWSPIVTETINGVVDSIFDTFAPVFLWLAEAWADIGEFMVETWDKYGAEILDNIGEFINGIIDTVGKIWSEIIDPIITPFLEELKRLWDEYLKDIVMDVIDFVGEIVLRFLEVWNTAIKPFIDKMIGIFGPVLSGLFGTLTRVIGGAIGGFLYSFKEVWQGIKEILRGMLTFIEGVFTGNWKKAWEGLKQIVGGVFQGMLALVKAPLNIIIGMINGLIRGLNKIKLPSWVPGIGGKGINIGTIPYLAKGGVLNRPTLNVAGEAGKEAVVPLENNTGWAKDFLNVLDGYGGVGNSQPQVIQLVVDSKVLAEVVNEQNEESNFSRNGGGMAWSM